MGKFLFNDNLSTQKVYRDCNNSSWLEFHFEKTNVIKYKLITSIRNNMEYGSGYFHSRKHPLYSSYLEIV